MPPSLLWFRRDLRLRDHPALLSAHEDGDGSVLPLFVVDPRVWERAGAPRRAYLAASLRALDEDLGGRLVVRYGDPVAVVPEVTRATGAGSVHVSEDLGPYGAARDAAVADALGDVPLRATGSPYAVTPGRVLTQQGTPYKVFTPFLKAWVEHGWRDPARTPDDPDTMEWVDADSEGLPEASSQIPPPEAGERAALERWAGFLDQVAEYPEDRDRPDRDGTSRMSHHLHFGEVHPRSLLADLGARLGRDPEWDEGARKLRAELAWREFHADMLHHRPEAVTEPLRPEFARMQWDEPGEQYDAWRAGRTGFPIVDAGMRELAETGYMHNRVRMIVASFLVKDLHVDWRLGAEHFLDHLVDGDLASNQLNWQWVAGCGSDAAPYFRVFNPITQGRKFDPDAAYIRRWVPELRDVDDPHEPVEPIVDHAEARREALARWETIGS